MAILEFPEAIDDRPLTATRESRSDRTVVPAQSTPGEDFLAEMAALVRRELRRVARQSDVLEPYRPTRHEMGDLIDLTVTGVHPAVRADVTLEVERFVGGGFAGQVYRARLLDVRGVGSAVHGLEPGLHYAVKILRPPSGAALLFRNLLFRLGYQAPFALQLNADAARAGALWQKLIRRAATIRFGSERTVADVYATFFDPDLGSHGEIGEWIDGRTWLLERDDHVFDRRQRAARPSTAGEPSFELVEKRRFMRDFVDLLHLTGAHELARQYEWSTWKSQPNALKRLDTGEGLTALDFRPGLALLFCLPMSPGDFALIVKGWARGKFVQFDDGSLPELAKFIEQHAGAFADLSDAHAELIGAHTRSREALPDLVNRPWRALTSLAARPVRAGAAEAWRRRGWLDAERAARVEHSSFTFLVLWALWWFPLAGAFAIKLWGSSRFRRHVAGMRRWNYFSRVMAAWRAGALIEWHRTGRINDEDALTRVHQPVRFAVERVLVSWLPAKLHRVLTDRPYTRQKVRVAIQFPIRFYRSAVFRETWLRGEIIAAMMKGILSRQDAERLDRDIADPLMRGYLKCLAIQLCTSPITHLVSVSVALYVFATFGTSWAQSLVLAAAVMAPFAVLPISPGSFVRGCWITSFMIRERRYKDYWAVAFLSFWQYIGFISVPLQVVFRFPGLALLLMTQAARKAAHRIPVFGESGALLEHTVFDLVFNVPVSIVARLRRRGKGAVA